MMARTANGIKNKMTGRFIADETIIGLYGFRAGKSFDEQFGRESIESILFYAVAFGM